MSDVERPARVTIKDPNILSERRRQLVDVALRVFTKRGYAATSVNEIAEVANFSIGSLYKYVSSKEELLYMVMDEVYTSLEEGLDFGESVDGNAMGRLEQTVRALFTGVDQVVHGLRLMYREYVNLPADVQREFMAREEKILRLIVRIIDAGNASGEFSCHHQWSAALDILAAAHFWSLKRWALKGVEFEDYVEQQTEIVLRMVGASKPRISMDRVETGRKESLTG